MVRFIFIFLYLYISNNRLLNGGNEKYIVEIKLYGKERIMTNKNFKINNNSIGNNIIYLLKFIKGNSNDIELYYYLSTEKYIFIELKLKKIYIYPIHNINDFIKILKNIYDNNDINELQITDKPEILSFTKNNAVYNCYIKIKSEDLGDKLKNNICKKQ